MTRVLSRLLAWQANLGAWPRPASAPNATPFVSLYAKGRLAGCFGNEEGGPGERLARAFLSAVSDVRFGGIAVGERSLLRAQLAYPRRMRWIGRGEAEAAIEPGTHGVGLARAGAPPVSLLPDVARDLGLSAAGLLETLAKKGGVRGDDLGGGSLFLFETEKVVVGPGTPGATRSPYKATDRAAAWLAELLDTGPGIVFGIDPRAREVHLSGPMLHARASVAVQALRAHGGHPPSLARASRWLRSQLERALAGRTVAGFPERPAMKAGTLALAALAGIHFEEALASFASRSELDEMPWHAAQVATALGARTPERLWRTCVADLEPRPWAPWTAMAARGGGDGNTLERCERALIASLRDSPPHRGGAAVTEVPEIAQTAVAVEALAPSRDRRALMAAARGREFLARWQLRAEAIPAALEPRLSEGAFPASPVAPFLRCDITGHALLALLSQSALG